MNIKGFGKATDEMISNFEKHIGFSLPEDYKQFLRDYNGGTSVVRYSTFFVEELNENMPLDVMYGLGVEKPFDLVKWYDEYKDDLFSNSIVIGDDPGSGKIVLITDPEFKGVYYWDHVFHFEQSSEDENTFEISESFKIFIEGLKNP
ncbi:SMI1/KNR4 family protein [Paenibacillus ehimensis]|uniref:SMI1/KNR4 family protein n=1 Tax=Paenibacillus ehimensis TaxID=79264 RepID=UPI0004728B3E|nr:SMI1/KNR4 family protein [Paenibacillus ehimensis]MEC0207378.1 SMI1/KNR4 family protein [Paenibacillus ehimensis]